MRPGLSSFHCAAVSTITTPQTKDFCIPAQVILKPWHRRRQKEGRTSPKTRDTGATTTTKVEEEEAEEEDLEGLLSTVDSTTTLAIAMPLRPRRLLAERVPTTTFRSRPEWSTPRDSVHRCLPSSLRTPTSKIRWQNG